MAFDFFKKDKKKEKKEPKFPAEEKKEVLKPKGNLPSPPKPENQKSEGKSKEEFKSMGDMTPSKPGEKLEEFKGSEKQKPTSLPPHKRREPIPQKAPEPGPVKGKTKGKSKQPSRERPTPPPPKSRGPIKPKTKKPEGKPHMYIKIDEYKKVMKKISELGEEIHQIRGELDDLKEVGKEERKNIEESKEITSKVNDILDYLQKTFTEATE